MRLGARWWFWVPLFLVGSLYAFAQFVPLPSNGETGASGGCVTDSLGNTVCNGVVMDGGFATVRGVVATDVNNPYPASYNAALAGITGQFLGQGFTLCSPSVVDGGVCYQSFIQGPGTQTGIWELINTTNEQGGNAQTHATYNGVTDVTQFFGAFDVGSFGIIGNHAGCSLGPGAYTGVDQFQSTCGFQAISAADPHNSGFMTFPNVGQTAIGLFEQKDGQDLTQQIEENVHYSSSGTVGYDLYNTAKPGWLVELFSGATDHSQGIYAGHFTPGSNPRTFVQDLQIADNNYAWANTGTQNSNAIQDSRIAAACSAGQAVTAINSNAAPTCTAFPTESSGTLTYDFASLVTIGCEASTSVTVTGAALGDSCTVGTSADVSGINGSFTCSITGSGTAKVVFCGIDNPPSMTFTVRAIR